MNYNPEILNGVDWLWFDLDDTLYDFSRSSELALHDTYLHFNLSRFYNSEEQWIDIYHRHNSMLWQQYDKGLIHQDALRKQRFLLTLQEVNAPESALLTLPGDLDSYYLTSLSSTGLVKEGAEATLRRAKELGFKIGILSNGFLDTQYRKLRSASLEKYIDCVVLSDEIDVNKPDKRLYDYALSKASTSADKSLMIGDNLATDIAGALNAGWKAVFYDPGAGHKNSDVPTIEKLDPNLIFSLKG